MPTEFPVYPKGRVSEAGGVEGGICDIRVVSFSTSASMQAVADYYYTRARRSGFTADYETRDGENVLGGTRDGIAPAVRKMVQLAHEDRATQICRRVPA